MGERERDADLERWFVADLHRECALQQVDVTPSAMHVMQQDALWSHGLDADDVDSMVVGLDDEGYGFDDANEGCSIEDDGPVEGGHVDGGHPEAMETSRKSYRHARAFGGR